MAKPKPTKAPSEFDLKASASTKAKIKAALVKFAGGK